MAASNGLKYKQENEPQQISTVALIYLIIMSNPTPVRELALEKYS